MIFLHVCILNYQTTAAFNRLDRLLLKRDIYYMIICQEDLKPMKPQNIMEYLPPTCEDGQETVGLKRRRHQEGEICTLSPLSQLLQDEKLSTVESHPVSNKEILTDKFFTCEKSILNTKLCQTLEAESMINVKGLGPFWNPLSAEMSSKLWLPMEIDSVDLGSASCSGFFHNSMHRLSLWKEKDLTNKKCSMTSWKSSPCFQQDTTEKESTKLKTIKIPIFPNAAQKKIFSKCFNLHQHFYNKAVSYFNAEYEAAYEKYDISETCIFCKKPKSSGFTCNAHSTKTIKWPSHSFIGTRKKLMKSNKDLDESEQYQKEVPFDTRQLAIKDAITAWKSCMTNKIRGNISSFKFHELKNDRFSKIFWLDDKTIKNDGGSIRIMPSLLKNYSKVRMSRKSFSKIPKLITSDAKIQLDHGKYYLILTVESAAASSNDNRLHSCALDPGVRSFMTGYSAEGTVFKYGEHMYPVLDKFYKKLDKLQERMKTARKKAMKGMRSKVAKLYRKLKNQVIDLHTKCAVMLCQNFKHVLLPKFETSNMLSKPGLHHSTKRKMQTLSHFRFQTKLREIAQRYKTNIVEVDERYTTKTCGSCGIMQDVGSKKIFSCSCGYELDRDIHGARNIFLKSTTIGQ